MTTRVTRRALNWPEEHVPAVYGRTMSQLFNARGKDARAPLGAAADSPLGDHLFFYLTQLEQIFRAGIQEALYDLDLDIRQYIALAYIVDGRAPAQHELVQLLRLDPSQVVTLTKGLAERGLLVRDTMPQDRRAKALVITADGRRLYAQAAVRVRRVEEALTASLSRRDHNALKTLLERVLPIS